MRSSWHEIWGCARGPVTRLAPQVRLLAGAGVFAACMVSPATTGPGLLVLATAVGGWLAACRLPWRTLRLLLLLGLALFLPYFLLTPLIHAGTPATPGRSWAEALRVPWGVFCRGTCGLLVSVATVASLSASHLREAMVRLPIPYVVSAILIQIVHQTGALFNETRRVAAAMAVRGASSGGRTAWRVLSSLPQVWLPRIIQRADRVSAAMELRGYAGGEIHSFESVAWTAADAAALLFVLILLGVAATLRFGVLA